MALWRRQALENPISHTDLVLGLEKHKLLLWIYEQQFNTAGPSPPPPRSALYTFAHLYNKKLEVNIINSNGGIFLLVTSTYKHLKFNQVEK